jgi:ABC-type multidrug transport system fused ATPase/permease subunit
MVYETTVERVTNRVWGIFSSLDHGIGGNNNRQALLRAYIASLAERGEHNADKLTVDGLVYLKNLPTRRSRLSAGLDSNINARPRFIVTAPIASIAIPLQRACRVAHASRRRKVSSYVKSLPVIKAFSRTQWESRLRERQEWAEDNDDRWLLKASRFIRLK